MNHIPNPQLKANQKQISSKWPTLLLFAVIFLLLSGLFLMFFSEQRKEKQRKEKAKATAAAKRLTEQQQVNLPPPPPPDEDFLDETSTEQEMPAAVKKEAGAKEPSKTELEKEYERLVAEYLSQLSPPRIGKEYEIRLRNGSTVRGRLEEINPGRIVLRVPYGTIAYAVNELKHSSLRKLFPLRAAQLRALREVQRLQRSRANEAEKEAVALPVADENIPQEAVEDRTHLETKQPEFAETEEIQDEVREEEPETASLESPAPENFYDATPSHTPAHLKDTIVAFGGWLEYQHRRIGGKLADRIFAKQQQQNVVLYIILNPAFMAQDYDLRFQLTEALWKFWSFRCEGAGVIRDLNDAHVVLVSQQNELVGGSTPGNAADIWVKK